MVAPKLVTLTIDGRTVQVEAGKTILQAAESVGIRIPALCHHSLLPDIGSCRMCLVEIERQRVPQPACTFPVAEGLVVKTDTARVQEARQMNLRLLFSERSHYCMICPSSGNCDTSDCELQKLAYEAGMASWPYPPNTGKKWEIDASHPYLILDHSRCVLCRRCVRACDTIAANHTLGTHQRGSRTQIGADDGVPLGKSTCISCGVCAELCPTGALTERYSAFAGHESELQWVASACMGCAVGCGIKGAVRDNRLVRVDGDWDSASGGMLCATGRFKSCEPIAAPHRATARLLTPRVRRDGTLVEASWEEAIAHAAEGLREKQAAGLISPRMPGESLAAFTVFMQEVLHSDAVSLLYGETPPPDIGAPAQLKDVAEADFVAVVGGDPLRHQAVLGYQVKRAYDRGASIFVVGNSGAGLEAYARWSLHLQDISAHAESPFARLRHAYHLNISGLKQLRSAAGAAARPVVLYAGGLSSTVYAALRELPRHARFLPLVVGANMRGAARLGLSARQVAGNAWCVLQGDEAASALPPVPTGERFIVVQAAYASAWTEAADVVLPAPLWTEKSGHMIALDGQERGLLPLVAPPAGVRREREALMALAQRLGHTLNFDEIPGVGARSAEC